MHSRATPFLDTWAGDEAALRHPAQHLPGRVLRRSGAHSTGDEAEENEDAAPCEVQAGPKQKYCVSGMGNDPPSRRDLLTVREAIVLREINDLSYREISDVVRAPVGTVMSRLARARAMLRKAWIAEEGQLA